MLTGNEKIKKERKLDIETRCPDKAKQLQVWLEMKEGLAMGKGLKTLSTGLDETSITLNLFSQNL